MSGIYPSDLLVEDVFRLVVDEIRLAEEVVSLAAVVVKFAVGRRVLVFVMIEPRTEINFDTRGGGKVTGKGHSKGEVSSACIRGTQLEQLNELDRPDEPRLFRRYVVPTF